MAKKILSLLVVLSLSFQNFAFPQPLQLTQQQLVAASAFRPVHLRYLACDSLSNNLSLFLDKGSVACDQAIISQTAPRLVRFFLTGLSLPDSSFWVNLRPDAPERMIDPLLAKTDVGRIMLEADLQLKKDLARLTSPETPSGKGYWDAVYKKAEALLGQIPSSIPTLSRPWIVPGEIILCESGRGGYIYKAILKVQLEEDRLKGSREYDFQDTRLKQLNSYSGQLLRERVLPLLTARVNAAAEYAALRQVFYSLILSQWFKKHPSALSAKFSGLIDSQNLRGLYSETPWSPDYYYNAYRESFNDGEYGHTQQVYGNASVKLRSCASGGITLTQGANTISFPASPVTDPRTTLGVSIDENLGNCALVPRSGIIADGGLGSTPLFYRDSEMDETYFSYAGRKAAVLAGFKKYLAKRHIDVSIPRYIVIPLDLAMSRTNKSGQLARENKKELEQGLAYIGEEHGRRFGDDNAPLLVSVRPSPMQVRPGVFVSVLNIGITDKNLDRLVDELGKEKAYGTYVKLIRDLAALKYSAGSHEQGLEEFDRIYGKPWKDALARLQQAKNAYKTMVGDEFPQDTFEQLAIAVTLTPFIRKDAAFEQAEMNGIIIQEMAWGNRADSLSGYAFSRNPVTGSPDIGGTCGNKQGDDFLDELSFDKFKTGRPTDFALVEKVLREAEYFLQSTAEIEFTLDRGKLHLLQVRGFKLPALAMLQALNDMVYEKIIPQKTAEAMIDGWDLDALQYEEQVDLSDAELKATGNLLSLGVSQYATGVAVTDEKQAAALRADNIPYIVVKPVVTADDSGLIARSKGVVVLREFGAHVQDISLSAGITAISHINIEDIGEGTVITLGPKGDVYVWDLPYPQVHTLIKRTRAASIPPALAQAMGWKISSNGKIPVYTASIAPEHSQRWQHNVHLDGNNLKNKLDRRHRVRIRNVSAQKKTAVTESKPVVQMTTKGVEGAAAEVLKQKHIEGFTHMFWVVYDKLDFYAAPVEGYKVQQFCSQVEVEYSNLAEMKGEYVRTVIRRDRKRFIEAVFHGVDRHKMAQFIFRSYIFKHLPKEEATQLAKEVIKYGFRNGYSGEIRGHAYQAGRILSHFIHADPALAKEILSGITPDEINFALNEMQRSVVNTVLHDSELATKEEIEEFMRTFKSADADGGEKTGNGMGGVDFSSLPGSSLELAYTLPAVPALSTEPLSSLKENWKGLKLRMVRNEFPCRELGELATALKNRRDGYKQFEEIRFYVLAMLRNQEAIALPSPRGMQGLLQDILSN